MCCQQHPEAAALNSYLGAGPVPPSCERTSPGDRESSPRVLSFGSYVSTRQPNSFRVRKFDIWTNPQRAVPTPRPTTNEAKATKSPGASHQDTSAISATSAMPRHGASHDSEQKPIESRASLRHFQQVFGEFRLKYGLRGGVCCGSHMDDYTVSVDIR